MFVKYYVEVKQSKQQHSVPNVFVIPRITWLHSSFSGLVCVNDLFVLQVKNIC